MKNIFIVDDIKINLKVLEVLLARNGYNVIFALSGKKALSQLQSTPVDMIISDIQMPEMDGFQFCRLCKLDKKLRHIPFVFYSSLKNDTEIKDLTQKVGAQEFISKPADPERLLKTIEHILYEYNSAFADRSENSSGNLTEPYNQRVINSLEKKTQGAQHGYSHGTLFNKIPCVVWTIDSKGKITYINKSVEKITGFSLDSIREMGKRGYLDRVHTSDAKLVRKAYKNLFENSIALEIEYQFKCSNGDFIWMYEKTGIPYNINGLLHVDGISIDISRVKFSQAGCLKSREIEVTRTFARGVFHDLENLFKGISGYIELSSMDSTTPSDREHYLSNALDISQNASKLIKNFSTLSTGAISAKNSVLFSSVVSKVTKSLLNNSGIQYKLEIPSGLWSCMVDSKLMEQAVANLIINAMEAVALDGFIEVNLENVFIKKAKLCFGSAVNQGYYVKATIKDNGHGIDKDILHQIFHPYYSTKSLNIKNGVGLSLALSEAIITEHGGVIVVHSGKEEGSIMDIYLPALKQEEKFNKG